MHNSLIISKLTCLFGLLFGLGGVVSAQTTTSSAPMGFYKLDLAVGYQTVGVSVVNSAVFGSWIDSSSTATVTATDASVDVGALLVAEKGYYIEIVEGPTGPTDALVGQRFEVDVATTIGPATGGGVIVLNMEAEATTWANDPPTTPNTAPDLAGYRFELRAHMTLGQVFDAGLLYGNSSFANADQVQVFDGAGFTIYYVLKVGDFTQWTRQGDDLFESQENLPIKPGQGLIFKRSALSSGIVTLRVQGLARVTPFVQPMVAGYNFIAEGFPITTSFTSRGADSADFSNLDRMQLFDGSGFDTYQFYTPGDTWVDVTDTTYMSQNLSLLFNYRGAVFVELSSPTTDYRIDPPYPEEPGT